MLNYTLSLHLRFDKLASTLSPYLFDYDRKMSEICFMNFIKFLLVVTDDVMIIEQLVLSEVI
jgi:hypothetical protein